MVPLHLAEACSDAVASVLLPLLSTPSRLVHNEAPKPYFYLSKSIWAQ
jgi:hypothetical protein